MFRKGIPHYHVDITDGDSTRRFHTNSWGAVVAILNTYVKADSVHIRLLYKRHSCYKYSEITIGR